MAWFTLVSHGVIVVSHGTVTAALTGRSLACGEHVPYRLPPLESERECQALTASPAYLPTQAAEFSGPDRQAIVIFCPGWTEPLLALLEKRPTAYEAAWRYAADERAHVLEVAYEGADPLRIALVDGVHNQLIAALVRGRALVLSPYPIYGEPGWEGELFAPETSLALPTLPSLLDSADGG